MRHVSAETMARFRQGDLNGRRSTRVSTHLAGCDRCSARSADLGRVTTLLAGAPQPRMPDEVTGRIRAALAAEAAVRAAGSVAKVPAGGPRAWRPRLPHPSHRVALRGLAAAAAVALLAGGGYAIVTATGASSTSTHAASAPSGEARPAVGVPGSGNGLMVPAHASGPTLQYRHDGHEADITPVATGTDFTRAGLAGQATSAVARYGAGSVVTRPNAAGPSHTAAVSGVAGVGERPATFGGIPVSMLQGCVNRIDAGNKVLLVDLARYDRAPATIIVTEAAVTGPMQIWVVGTGCSASRSDVLAHARAAAS